jgi:uncharacterized membrane protein
MKLLKYLIFSIFLLLIFLPSGAKAQELVQDESEIVKAKVIQIMDQKRAIIPGTDIEGEVQTLEVEILEGQQKGEKVVFENDYILLKPGDKFFLYHSIDAFDGVHRYVVKDFDRRFVLYIYIALFVAVVLLFSGKQGVRSLLGLGGSFFVILYILIPSLLKGYPPMLTSIAIASIILFLAIYLTHGFNRVSTVAFGGTVIAVALTGVLAYVGVTLAHFTGFASEESFYLNLNTRGALDFTGLLLGGIMIGVLGVLDDIAITQAAVVRELYHGAPQLSKKEVYKKALRVGREHVSALVNTLALAYTGASLPLLLLLSSSTTSAANIINQEIFATEIVRTIVGSIGLILTVPITTALAAYWLKDYTGSTPHDSHQHSH